MCKKAQAKRFNQREEAAIYGEELKKSLDEDRKRPYQETARELESVLLAKGDIIIKRAFGKAQKWCRKRGHPAPFPIHITATNPEDGR